MSKDAGKALANTATLGFAGPFLTEKPKMDTPDIPEPPEPEPLPDPDDPLLRRRKRRKAAAEVQKRTGALATDLGFGERRDTLG